MSHSHLEKNCLTIPAPSIHPSIPKTICMLYHNPRYPHQWYCINTNEITDNHNIAICNDTTINMVPLPTAEPSESNAFERIARLSLSQNQREPPNDIQTQSISKTSILTNNNICNTPQNSMTWSHDQSTIIMQQFSMIIKELKMSQKVYGGITKITQAYNTAQENTGKFTENAISQALTKAQNITTSSTSLDPRNFGVDYANSSCETNWTTAWPTSNLATSQQPEIDTHQTQRLNKAYTLQNLYKSRTSQSDPF